MAKAEEYWSTHLHKGKPFSTVGLRINFEHGFPEVFRMWISLLFGMDRDKNYFHVSGTVGHTRQEKFFSILYKIFSEVDQMKA